MIAGAVGSVYALFQDDEADSSSNDTEGREQNSSDEKAPQQQPNESRDQAGGNTSKEQNATENESREAEAEDEKPLTPDENETRHEGDYNESASGELRETEPRPPEHVEITDRSAVMNDRGGVTFRATVTNTSAESIDAIDIYVDYTVQGEYVYGDSVVVRDLGAGASEQIKSTAPPGRVGGANPDDLGVEIVEVTPYDYANSGE